MVVIRVQLQHGAEVLDGGTLVAEFDEGDGEAARPSANSPASTPGRRIAGFLNGPDLFGQEIVGIGAERRDSQRLAGKRDARARGGAVSIVVHEVGIGVAHANP